jgi:hypothetical protein
MIRVTFDLDQFAVLDVCQDPAAAMAAGTGGPGSGAHDLTTFAIRQADSSSPHSVHQSIVKSS